MMLCLQCTRRKRQEGHMMLFLGRHAANLFAAIQSSSSFMHPRV